MDDRDLLNIPPYFHMYDALEGGSGCMRYIYDTNVYGFNTKVSKTMTSSTLQTLSSGLNHLLAWAKDLLPEYSESEYNNEKARRENEFKRKFILEFTIYLHDLHKLLTSDSFHSLCYSRMALDPIKPNGQRPTESNVLASILGEKIIEFMDNPVLMTGILKYVYQYSRIDVNKQSAQHLIDVNLNKHDIFAFMATSTLGKIVHLAFSVYSTSTKAEVIVFDSISIILKKIKDKIIDFHHDVLYTNALEMSEILENDFEEHIIDYLYSRIDLHLNAETNRSVFENIGISDTKTRNTILRTTLTSIYKFIPVDDSSEVQSSNSKDADQFKYQKNWRDFRYVANAMIKYVNTIVKNVSKASGKYSTEVTTHTTVDDSTETNITYKQEMFLESRNKQSLYRKKHMLRRLSRYCVDKLVTEVDPVILANVPAKLPIDNPLRSYMLIVVMNEMFEDVSTIQLLQTNNKINLIIVIADKLYKLGYTQLAGGVIASAVGQNTAELLPNQLEVISKLRKYTIDPVKTTRYITDIVCRLYIGSGVDMAPTITITDEFLDFLKKKEDKNFRLLDNNILTYTTDGD